MSGILGTFGKSPAAKTLAKILHETNDKKNLAKVSKILSNFNTTLNELSKIDSKVGFYLGRVVYMKTKQECEKYPDTFKTYFMNVLTASYRQWLADNNSTTPRKLRADYHGKNNAKNSD